MPTQKISAENSIQNSSLPEGTKQQLLQLLPVFGSHMQEYIAVQLARTDASLGVNSLIAGLTTLSRTLADLNTGTTSSLEQLFANAKLLSILDFGSMVVPFCLDLDQFIALRKIRVTPDIAQSILDFEILDFTLLEDEDLRLVLSKHLSYIYQQVNVLENLKYYYYTKEKSVDVEWTRALSRILETSQDSIGNIPRTGNSGAVPTVIGDWVKDFAGKAQLGVANKGSLGLAEYMQKSADVAKLPKADQQVLLKILQTYLWLRNPNVTQEEIRQIDIQKGEFVEKDPVSEIDEWIDREIIGIVKSTNSKPTPKIPVISSVPKVPRPPQAQQNRQAVNLQEQLIASGSEVKEITSPKPFTDLPAPKTQETKRNPVTAPSPLPASANIPMPKAPSSAVVAQNKPVSLKPPKPPVRPSVGIPLKPDIAPRKTGFTPNIQDLLNSDKGKRSGDLSGMTLSGVLPPKLDMDSIKKESAVRAKQENETDTTKQNT